MSDPSKRHKIRYRLPEGNKQGYFYFSDYSRLYGRESETGHNILTSQEDPVQRLIERAFDAGYKLGQTNRSDQIMDLLNTEDDHL